MNATQAVLGLRGSFVHGFSVHVDKVDSLFLVGAVACEVTYFTAVEAGVIGGTRLVNVSGSSLEVLVSSLTSSLVAPSTPVCIRLAKVHCYRLVVHAGRGVRCVLLRGLFGVIGVVPPVEEWVSLLVSSWSQGVSRVSSFLSVVSGL